MGILVVELRLVGPMICPITGVMAWKCPFTVTTAMQPIDIDGHAAVSVGSRYVTETSAGARPRVRPDVIAQPVGHAVALRVSQVSVPEGDWFTIATRAPSRAAFEIVLYVKIKRPASTIPKIIKRRIGRTSANSTSAGPRVGGGKYFFMRLILKVEAAVAPPGPRHFRRWNESAATHRRLRFDVL